MIADAAETSITDQILLPVFSPELEQKIFETTAFLHPFTILKLLLVARRVHFWIEPMLYNTVQIAAKSGSGAAVLRAIHTKPAGFFHKAVRNLFLFPIHWIFSGPRSKDPWSDEELAGVLRACSGVVNLLLFCVKFSSPVTLPMLAPAEMRPQRITVIADSDTTLDLTRPVFTNVRRLDLLAVRPENDSIFENAQHLRNLTRLSSLTHIAFESRVAPKILNTILSGCLNLQMVLLLGEGFAREAAELHDQRLVVHENFFREGGEHENHQDFFEGGKDIWAGVDEFMARKQRGEIPGIRLFFEGDDSEL
ncbi:hypothetical protein GGX14DRAFT_588182 [Mycena pura]|uniref:Uncharacterized protein n=1 Tax=Mycena pura TaxID=153505 RepID=A0AAD6XZ91_9AGAR|nr:hypothetical protein GGX14DRAFT_588182 [Mycena pura]